MTTVLLFARARELAGTKTAEIDGTTAAEVVRLAGERFGDEFVELCATCSIVVDGEVVPAAELAAHDPGTELAILPPVSGGATDEQPHDHHHSDVASITVGVLTVSDRASSGEYEDLTGPSVEAALLDALDTRDTEVAVVVRDVVPDSFDRIVEVVRRWCDADLVDLVVTNGGTGLSPRDVTPEAVRSLLDVEAPGLAELMRARGLAHTPMAALSRQVAGRRGHTIVVAVPGSVKGAVESIQAIADVLPHAVATAGERR